MLDERIVGAARGRRSEEVAPVGVMFERRLAPEVLSKSIRGICEHDVEGLQLAASRERGVHERIVLYDPELLKPVQEEVHPRDRRGERLQLLSVRPDLAPGIIVGIVRVLQLGYARNEHAARAACRVVDRLLRLGFEDVDHQFDYRAVRVELLRGVPGIVGELADQMFVRLAHLVGRTRLDRKVQLREVLDQPGNRLVRQDVLVAPDAAVAEYPFKALDTAPADNAARIRLFDADPCRRQRLADVRRYVADILPVAALGDCEGVVLRRIAREILVPGLRQRPLVLFLVHVADALEEHQRKDVLLVPARVDAAAQKLRSLPKRRFQFLQIHFVPSFIMPEAIISVRNFSDADLTSATACSNSAFTSAYGRTASAWYFTYLFTDRS